MPRLRVLAGPSPDSMVPISHTVNSGTAHPISSDLFEGHVVAHIQGFTDERGSVRESEYFGREERKGVTWSIQVQGRFLQTYSADDILFGNTFDRPLRLPWGSGAALKFMKYVDPTLDHDLSSSTKPWALSPLISTMPYFAHHRVDSSTSTQKPFPPPSPHCIKDDTSQLHLALNPSALSSSSSSSSSSSGSSADGSISGSPPDSRLEVPVPPRCGRNGSSSSLSSVGSSASSVGRGSILSSISGANNKASEKKERKVAKKREENERRLRGLEGAEQRRGYFRERERRREVLFGPEDVITTDFCYGFLQFSPALSLRLPGGVSFDLMHYWDGQPVRFVCCRRKGATLFSGSNSDDGSEGQGQADGDGDGDEPWGRVFWCVAIELADDEEEDGEGVVRGGVDEGKEMSVGVADEDVD